MLRNRCIHQLALLVPAFVVLVGCGSGGDVPTDPTRPETVVLAGEVMSVEDMVPVDGGVTIEIALAHGATDHLLFPSLFTSPPPNEATLNLYDVVRRVEVGDVVRASGTRTPLGLSLESLAILSGRS